MNHWGMLAGMFGIAARVALCAAAPAYIWSFGLRRDGSQPRAVAPEHVEWLSPSIRVEDALDRPRLGAEQSRIVIYEYSDFQCPFCARHAQETLPLIQRRLLRSGSVSYVFRHFPLRSVHPGALIASQASECAAAQERFWEMHERLFTTMHGFTAMDLGRLAADAGLRPSTFSNCLNGPLSQRVEEDLRDAERLAIHQTPTFVIAAADRHGRYHAVAKILGARPISTFERVIARVLAQAGDARVVGRADPPQ